MNCKNDILMKKVGSVKLDNTVEVDINVRSFLPDCKKINALKRLSPSNARTNGLKSPANQFECLREGCVNSGTLYPETAESVYKAQFDGTEFAAGVVTFYVIQPEGGASVTFKIGNEEALTNANVYTIPLADMKVGKDGYTAVVVDLSKVPTSVEGEGWTPSASGANYIGITVTPTDEEADTSVIGISSISIFDDMDDFVVSTLVKMGCVTGIDGSWDLEAAEASCFGGGYSDDIQGFDRTLTGNALTPNYNIVNPLFRKGNVVTAYDNINIEKIVEDGGDYGVVTIADMNQDVCGNVSAALADSCDVTNAQLERLSIPNAVDIDEKKYQVIANDDGSTTILFNKEHIGQPVLISYPVTKDAEEWDISDKHINDVRVSLSYVRRYTDGTKYRFVFNNVLVTSFNDSQTTNEGEFSITFSIRKDADGRFGKAYRYID